MSAKRGASGNAATNMVVKLNWITKDRAKQIILYSNWSTSLMVWAFSKVQTHLQELIEQAEGVNVIEAVVAEPVSNLTDITQFSSVFGLWFVFQVAVGTFPLQPLGSSSIPPPTEPADGIKRQHETACSESFKRCTCRWYIYLRACEFKDIADGLFEYHYNCHLNEEVCKTSTGVTLHRMYSI